MMTRTEKTQRTQWSAQFLAASELVRNGYVVSFTMGNRTPLADLMVGRQDVTSLFWVDVKGLGSNNSWLIKRRDVKPGLFYILVRVGVKRDGDVFFILSHDEINTLIDDSHRRYPNDPTDGFAFKDAAPYTNRWDILPGWRSDLLQSN